MQAGDMVGMTEQMAGAFTELTIPCVPVASTAASMAWFCVQLDLGILWLSHACGSMAQIGSGIRRY